MHFAMEYTIHPFKYEPDEYNITYTKNSTITELLKFLSNHQEKRINVLFEEKIPTSDELLLCMKTHDSFYVRIQAGQLYYLQEIQNNNINFFFDSSLSIDSYGLLDWALTTGTDSVYIANDLVYNLPEIYKRCTELHGISLRIVLNKLPITEILYKSKDHAMIFSPQDFSLLDKYFYTGEFLGCDLVQLKAQYEAWFINHYWDTDLRFLIKGLPQQYLSATIPPELNQYRIQCKYRCMTYGESKCSKCKRLMKIANFNKERNLKYKPGISRTLPTVEEIEELVNSSKE